MSAHGSQANGKADLSSEAGSGQIGTKSQMHLFNRKMRTSMYQKMHWEQQTWGV